MFNWRRICRQTVVTKMMDILNKLLNSAACFTNTKFLPAFFGTPDLVACKRFMQHFDQRTVTRKINAVQPIILIGMSVCDVQTNQCLARAGDSSHEKDGLFAPFSGSLDQAR